MYISLYEYFLLRSLVLIFAKMASLGQNYWGGIFKIIPWGGIQNTLPTPHLSALPVHLFSVACLLLDGSYFVINNCISLSSHCRIIKLNFIKLIFSWISLKVLVYTMRIFNLKWAKDQTTRTLIPLVSSWIRKNNAKILLDDFGTLFLGH